MSQGKKTEYLPFFRKYRPQSFRHVVGQESLVKALSNAIELGRIANAYLFCGPRGTGKTSSARILAKSLNCVEGPTLDPCQKCPSCLDITNTAGLDVIEIDAATNRGIADAKELIAQVQYAPMNGKYKIFIIDEVHMLSTEAFNALLKTFEEPPANVIFILATTEPHKVIETIVSRCQRFDFRRISTDDIIKKLREIAELEKIKITDDALFTIAKNVSGGLRDSLALLDQVSILGVKEEISKELIEDLLGKITIDTLCKLLSHIVQNDLENALRTIDSIYSKGNEPRSLCENFIEFLRNVIVVLNAQNPLDVIKFTTFSAANVENTLASFRNGQREQKDELIRILNKVIGFYKDVKSASNPYLWVELMVIDLCSSPAQTDAAVKKPAAPAASLTYTASATLAAPVKAQPIVTEQAEAKPMLEAPVQTAQTAQQEEVKLAPQPMAAAVQEDIKEEESAAESAPEIPHYEPETIAPPASDIKQTEKIQEDVDLQEVWSKIVNSIESVPAKFFFSGMARLVGVQEDSITIGFTHPNSLAGAKTDSKMKPLEKALTNVFERKLNIQLIQISKDAPAVEAQVQPVKKNVVPQPTEVQPLEDIVENRPVATALPPKEEIAPESAPALGPTSIVKAAYTQKTKEMIENFNGKVID